MSGLRDLLADLVAIDSINPELVPGGAGEAEVGRFVASWLADRGLDVTTQEPAPGRVNVIGVARGSGGGRSLLLNAHMDTVGVTGMPRPHTPRVQGDRLYGRGSYDMKAGLAAIMWAGAQAARGGLAGDVIVTAVCDEEYASIGAEALAREWTADAAIVTEPTGDRMRLCVAHKGFTWHEIEVRGRAAHGSRYEEGVDAIVLMGHVLVGLGELDRSLRERAEHPLLGFGSLHASLIEGGQELSSYPDRCLLRLERRTLPGEDRAAVEAELRRAIGEIPAELRTTFVREPFEVGADQPIVTLAREVLGGGEPIGVPFWADSAVLSAAGIPTVIFGPGGAGAHAVEEWVDLTQLDACARALMEVAERFCVV